MHIVLGASGHVGSVVAATLLDRGALVTAVLRDAGKAESWANRGALVAIADVRDVSGLRAILRGGRRAFLLNPPADPATDSDVEERRTADAIAAAVAGSGLEKVVVESTYGAQPGERIGDLSVLYEFEQAIAASGVPAAVQRAAYYMSNWDAQLDRARRDGVIASMNPADLDIPMVAPVDLGRHAAEMLLDPSTEAVVDYVEGPARYSANDVARAFATALGRPVLVEVTPREEWESAFRALGFSAAAAASYARMTAVSVDGGYDMPDAPVRGETPLDAYVAELVGDS